MSLAGLIRNKKWTELEDAWNSHAAEGGAVEPALEAVDVAARKKELPRITPMIRDHAESLAANAERDQQAGSTQAGPHRADLRLAYEDHRARKKVSRGQQKLLSCVLVLAAAEVVQTHLERPLLLLLDDPAAELDSESLARLMAAVCDLGCQVIATSLEPGAALFPEKPRLFHVEHGELQSAE